MLANLQYARSESVPESDDERKREIEIIEQIAVANGFQRSTLQKILKKTQDRKEKPKEQVEKYLGSIPYVGRHTDKVIKAFKKYDVNVGIKNNPSMVKRISNDQTEVRERTTQSGVYRLTCEQCDSVYIGETGRKFSTRMKEHKRSRVNGDGVSWFGKHCNEKQHTNTSAEQNFEIIKVENNLGKRRLKEQLEILKVKKERKVNLLNNVTTFESERLFSLVIGGKRQRHRANRNTAPAANALADAV